MDQCTDWQPYCGEEFSPAQVAGVPVICDRPAGHREQEFAMLPRAAPGQVAPQPAKHRNEELAFEWW